VGQKCRLPQKFANNPSFEAKPASLKYVLSDVQGTTRAVTSNNGSSSAVISRHDYLPFGEELWAGIGSRSSSTQAYGATDGNRQKYGFRRTSWGQACDLCDFGFGSPGCGVCAPLFQQAGGHLALTPDLAERLTIKSNSRALSFYV